MLSTANITMQFGAKPLFENVKAPASTSTGALNVLAALLLIVRLPVP